MNAVENAPPTERQSEVHRFMIGFQAERGYPPTVREIGEAFGFTSPNGVLCHLKALERKGMLRNSGSGLSRGRVALSGAGGEACCEKCGRPLAPAEA